MAGNRRLPIRSDFPANSTFLIKEFDVPIVQIAEQGYFNWFGGVQRPYDQTGLRVDNNWQAGSFEEWLGVIKASIK